MNFYTPDLLFSRLKAKGFSGTIDEAIANLVRGNKLLRSTEIATSIDQLILEKAWYSACRPYYKVWPSIVESLLKIKLELSPQSLVVPCKCIVVRFPTSDERFQRIQYVMAACGFHPIQGFPCLLMSYGSYAKHAGDSNRGACLNIRLDLPTIEDGMNSCWQTPGYTDLDPTSAEGINNFDFVAAKCVLGVCLLANDATIIQPDVLAADRDRFDASADPAFRQRLIDKARKRGVVGWRIGEQYETIPHYRRPHPALYHVGKGRHDQRIVFRAGSIVHRQKLTEIPTGYLTEEGEEIES